MTPHTPCAEIDKKNCAGHRSTPIYEHPSTPPPKAPRGSQGGPLQSKSFQQKHSPIDIFKRCHINANIVILLNLFVIVGWHTWEKYIAKQWLYSTLTQMNTVQMFHHSLLFFSCDFCLHLSFTDKIAMSLFKCMDTIVCLLLLRELFNPLLYNVLFVTVPTFLFLPRVSGRSFGRGIPRCLKVMCLLRSHLVFAL